MDAGGVRQFPEAGERPLVFAGSTQRLGTSDPLFSLGEITARVLAPRGYSVQVLNESGGPLNPRFVGDGRADLGATQPGTAARAFAGRGEFAGEAPRDNLCAIATICRPYWVALAVSVESGITDLSQIKERRLPLRFSIAASADSILRHYGLSRDELLAYGGQEVRGQDSRNLQLIISNMYLANTPAGRRWLEACTNMDLRFLDLPDKLIERILEEDGEGEQGFIPHGYLPGVDHDVRTVSRPYLIIYTRDDAPGPAIRTLAEGYDRERRYFRETHVNFSYDTEEVAMHAGIPLHPAALAYYQERGYPT